MDNEAVLCIICWNEGVNPITAECGHAICMSCFSKKSSPFSCCTSCWEYSQLRTSQVDIVMHPEGEGICEMHREDQKLFCDRTKTVLCVTCSKSQYHENHIHWPIAVAALHYRKKIEEVMDILCRKIKIHELFLLQQKERPLAWTVIWVNDTNTERQTDQKVLKQIWEYLRKKATDEELIVEDRNKKFIELYQRLKEIEATQEHQIMEQKKKWEAMMASHIRSLIDIKIELEETMQKPDVEMLQDVAETLARGSFWLPLKPFIPNVEDSYLNVVKEFLQYFQRHKLSEKCNFYNLSEERERAIRIVPVFSGKKHTVYIFGSFQPEDIGERIFFIRT